MNVGYNNIHMGSNVMLRKKRGLSSGINVNWKTPQLANTKGGYMLIATNKNELLKSNPDLIVIDGSNQELLIDNVNDHTDYEPSGILVLCIAKLERESVKSQYLWGPKDASNIKKWKTNIITGHSSHFGSTGNYYSFGNRANYGLIGLSSLTQFVHKKVQEEIKDERSYVQYRNLRTIIGSRFKEWCSKFSFYLAKCQRLHSSNLEYSLQGSVRNWRLQFEKNGCK